jgi:hypothetical protein
MKLRSLALTAFTLSTLLAASSARAANSLSLGADYLLRGVSVSERDTTTPDLAYYDQQLKAYLITDLSKDVEATVRVQSITPWGNEGSTTTLATRYPDTNGRFWLQNAFVRLPNIWQNRIVATIGRQPIQWGDGLILSDDDLGFNALRLHLKSPWRFLPVDLDGFTAKINETLQADADTDLHGVMLGFDRNFTRWEIMGLAEQSKSIGNYQAGAETAPVSAMDLTRMIYGVRARVNLKDAFLKGEYYVQRGNVERPGGNDINLKGDAYALGLGGKQNTTRWGRFGALLEYAVGSGDDPSTAGDDESFRPTFAHRWSGLERSGWGRYAAATFSDIRSSTNPFANASSTNSGLPAGTSGIQTIHFGVDATPWSQWTFSFDYFTYKAQRNLAGNKDLGTEFDYGIEYRYSGLVTARGTYSSFIPKDAFDPVTKTKASMSTFEVDLRF